MINRIIILLSLIFITFASCSDGSGPKDNVYVPDQSIDEMVNEVLDAEEGNGWLYMYDVDLHTKVDGNWINAGRFSVYENLADNDQCNLWVEFNTAEYRMPVYTTDKYGYNFKVQWQGDWYYF